jgi:hypothetical protein
MSHRPHAPLRQEHVATVADDVDEARFGEEIGQQGDLPAVVIMGGLVAPARLPVPCGIETEHRPEGRGGVEGTQLLPAAQQFVAVELQVRKERMPRDVGQQALRVGGRPARHRVGDEARLGRDGQVRMRVEHEPQQRGAGPRQPDDERRGR